MSETTSERYRLPPELDRSLSAMQERLMQLQPPLEALMGKALELFDGVYPQAPHPSVDSSVAYATATMNRCPVEGIPMGRELTVVLGAGKWVRIFRTTSGSPDCYPRERLWLWQRVANAHMKVDVFKTHDPARTEYPYDIEVLDYDTNGRHLGFVGGCDYYGKEPFIGETSQAIDTASQIAQDNGLFISR